MTTTNVLEGPLGIKGDGSGMLLRTTTHCHNPNDNHSQEADKDHYTVKWYTGCKGWNSDPKYKMTGKVNSTSHVTPNLPCVLLLISKLHATAQHLSVTSSLPFHNCELCNHVTNLVTNYLSMSTHLSAFGFNPICLLNAPSTTSIHTAKSLNLVITDFCSIHFQTIFLKYNKDCHM
jgi:hypothetical protein